MKGLLLAGLSLALCLTSTPLHGHSVQDDFNDGVIDTNLWDVYLPNYGTAGISEGGGNLTLLNGAIVTAKQSFENPTIEGRFKLYGWNYDRFKVVFRSDGQIDDHWQSMDGGLGVQFVATSNPDYSGQGNIQLINLKGTAVKLAEANYSIDMNVFYDFKIVDDGFNISVYINGSTSPVLSYNTSADYGDLVEFSNRSTSLTGPPPYYADVDHIKISSAPRLDINVAAVGLRFFAASTILYAVQSSTNNMSDWENAFIIEGQGAYTNLLEWVDEDREFYRVVEIDVETGLVAFYPFNGNANDESGKGNDLIVSGATLTSNRLGQVNRAYSFDGNDQLRSTGRLPLLENLTHTVSAWVKSTSGSDAGLAGYTSDQPTMHGNSGYQLRIRLATSKFAFLEGRQTAGGAWDYADADDSEAGDGVWHHLVGVRGGSTAMLYVDGVQQVDTTTLEPAFDDFCKIYIGSDSQIYFQGSIDDIRVFNKALSDAEIQYLYSLSE